MPTMIIARGSVASLGFGAILAASNAPTSAIIDPADMTKAMQVARIQTFRGSLVARGEDKVGAMIRGLAAALQQSDDEQQAECHHQ